MNSLEAAGGAGFLVAVVVAAVGISVSLAVWVLKDQMKRLGGVELIIAQNHERSEERFGQFQTRLSLLEQAFKMFVESHKKERRR